MFPVNQDTLHTSIRRGLRPVKYITHINNASEEDKASRETLIKSLDLLYGLSNQSVLVIGNEAGKIRTILRKGGLPLGAVETYYERSSVQQAVKSRYELKDHVVKESEAEFLLRLYGKFGLSVNQALRRNMVIKDSYNNVGIQLADKRNVYAMRVSLGPRVTSSVSLSTNVRRIKNELKNPPIVKSIENLINDMIEKHSVTFRSGEKKYLYRISRVNINNYKEDPVTGISAISVGDVIVDYGFLSVGIDAKSIVYRYSSFEASATHDASKPVGVDEEEVLYIIESNRYIKALNIAGFKLARRYDMASSGELLVRSGQRFRVAAIGLNSTAGTRRVVALEPVVVSPVDVGSFKDMFDGARIGLNEI